MKLPIISEDAGAKIACGRGTGNYFIISDGLNHGNNIIISYCYNYNMMGAVRCNNNIKANQTTLLVLVHPFLYFYAGGRSLFIIH